MAEQYAAYAGAGDARHALIQQEVDRFLAQSQAFNQLDPATQQSLRTSLGAVTQALGRPELVYAGQLAPDLRSQLRPHPDGSGDAASPASGQPTPAAGPAGGSIPATPTGRVGDVTRATLNAIDFPGFVASLIQGTFKAIVDASIQQMQAYAELLKNVATTLDRFMEDNVSPQTARDFLADSYDGVFAKDTSSGQPKLVVKKGAANGSMPSFLTDLGFQSADEIDDDAINNTIVPAARRDLAQQRHQTLATMVLMGMNRIVVDTGEITAKLQFHIDATESTDIKFDQSKNATGKIAKGGRAPMAAGAIMVNTVSLNAQSDINVRADLMGQVKVNFRSDILPLERFADSAAIQLINQNARVPQPLPPPAAPGQPTASSVAPAARPEAQLPPPAPPAPPAPAPAAPAATPRP
jgi:hypothetical protein